MVQAVKADDWVQVQEIMDDWADTEQVEWFDRAMTLRDAINDKEWEKVVALAHEWDAS